MTIEIQMRIIVYNNTINEICELYTCKNGGADSMNLTLKLLSSHLLEGELKTGNEVKLRVDQTLTQDSTGTMVYLQLLALDPVKIAPETAVAYIDHNLLQAGFENADDHDFIRTVASKYGIKYSKAGNGICHQLHLERYAVPGKLLIGSDSHTPTCGAMGMLAIGAGGLDVAVGLAYGYYTLKVPKVIGVHLTGALKPWVNGKDVILTLLKQLTVKGGVGSVIEYFGDGVASLTLTDRATITNMGAELGATTSVFPSDNQTYDYLKRQGREGGYIELKADTDSSYDQVIQLDLNAIEPMVALPHSPDNVVTVDEAGDVVIDQVAIGSCTNSSFKDLMRVANILDGKQLPSHVSLVISPGSSTILNMLAENGALGKMIASGARILEAACGPCIGMGQAPKSNAISLRTFNRNFKGRCGTESASVYLVSPETAAISALEGKLVSPATLESNAALFEVTEPEAYKTMTHYMIEDTASKSVQIEMGPNIKPFPINVPLPDLQKGKIILKTGDNITTDDIVPSNASLLPLRSNVPELSKHCFKGVSSSFYEDAVVKYKDQNLIIVGGENYGQGSSREHAALVPLYLGVRVVLAKSFARIHRANLINSGILPLIIDAKSYRNLAVSDEIHMSNLEMISDIDFVEGFDIFNETKRTSVRVRLDGSLEDVMKIRAGGQINLLKSMSGK